MATFTCGEIMRQAGVTLQDEGATRWTYPELLDHLNHAVRAVVSMKPNANSQNVVLTLVAGCEQSLAANQTVLSRVIRNITSEGPPRVGGATIRMLKSREMMDAIIPGWMATEALPFGTTVHYVIYDISTPTTFFVAPGISTTAKIEVTVGIQPTDIAKPVSPLDINSYTATVGLDSKYFNVLLDFMLYRALTKDGALPGSAQRAVAHKTLFDDAMKALIGGEMAMSATTHYNGG